VTFDEVIAAATLHRLEAGKAFEVKLFESLPEAPDKPLAELFLEDHNLFGTPLFHNTELGFAGAPDGIATRCGELIPIEVKAHTRTLVTDRLELAFYWQLLEPYRAKRPSRARGLLILKGQSKTIEVELSERDFRRVHALVDGVRRARHFGIEARACRCNVCVMRPETTHSERKTDLSRIHGIGWRRAEALVRGGINTLVDLETCNSAKVRAALTAEKLTISVATVNTWIAHAKAYRTGCINYFGRQALRMDGYIGLDVEYDGLTPWLIGLIMATSDGSEEIVQWWVDDEQDLCKAFAELTMTLCTWPDHRLVTWNGTGADVPILRSASHNIPGAEYLVATMVQRHLDMYSFVLRNVRYPIASLGLKHIADYYGVARSSTIADGFEALTLYRQYQSSNRTSDKRQTRELLMQYNQDDLRSLSHVVRQIRLLKA
jgi:predicted RecB family nuclease